MATRQWTDAEWRTLANRIGAGTVTPVVGAGASADIVGDAAGLARAWADDAGYPFDDDDRLPAVAHYVATMEDRARPAEYLAETLAAKLDGFVVAAIEDRHHPYRALPKHGFPTWLTTNYDDLIRRALNADNRPPRIGVARWTPPDLYWDNAEYDLSGFTPAPEQPLVSTSTAATAIHRRW